MNVNIIIKNAKTIAEYKEMKEKMKQLAEKCYNKHKKESQYHQLCWWFVIALPGLVVFPPKGGLTNQSVCYW